MPHFKYLGTIISGDLDDTLEIESRIKQARKSFGTMSKDILRNKRTATKLRVQLYQQCVVSILLANCETWALTEKLILKLTRFHHDCARSMCKLTRWHHRKYGITMKDILENRLGGLLPIEKIIRVRQLRFLNRVARMNCDRLTFQVLTSQLKATTAITRAAPGRKR